MAARMIRGGDAGDGARRSGTAASSSSLPRYVYINNLLLPARLPRRAGSLTGLVYIQRDRAVLILLCRARMIERINAGILISLRRSG